MEQITEKCYAKINLGLDVTGIREDGYHLVRMIMQTIGLNDVITLKKTKERQVSMEGSRADLPCDDSNLCVKAAKLIQNEYPQAGGVHIILEKNIPVAAGMAGGSTDCAGVLRGMNRLYELGLSDEQLMKLGVQLGADVPYCIKGGTMLSEGIGEVLSTLPDVMNCSVLIAKPKRGASTKEIYQALDALENPKHPDIDSLINALKTQDYQMLCTNLGNILEGVTMPLIPEIGQIKELMTESGCDGVLMSGSGPTVFGLFLDEEKLKNCRNSIAAANIAPELFITEMITNIAVSS